MGYYTIRLDPDASKICTIMFPWRKYSYKRLPRGIAGSPDIFQGKMLELMESLGYVRVYLDDLLCISKLSLEGHLEKLEEVRRRLRDAGHQKSHHVPYYIDILLNHLGIFNLGSISTFFTLRSFFINLE
jgi:hypothetical protein